MNTIKNIHLGYRQLKFDFDQSEAHDAGKLLTHIDVRIADNDCVRFDEVVTHFSEQPHNWTQNYVRMLMLDLFRDAKIQFQVDGENILPKNARQHLSESTQWKHIEIIKPEVIGQTDLVKAQQLANRLFGPIDFQGQNSLCRSIRKHLRIWKIDLETYRKFADTGNYPGQHNIDTLLLLIEKHLSRHDPAEFIKDFFEQEDSLLEASVQFAKLSHFYKNQMYIWSSLIEAVEMFGPDQETLKKDSDAKNALQRLYEIMISPEPYDAIDEISGLIASVKAVHDVIVEHKTDAARRAAIDELEKKIKQMTLVLDRKNASSDLRNKALLPLQTLRRNIQKASNISFIHQYSQNAVNEFELALDLLDA